MTTTTHTPSVIRQELDIIESKLHETAGYLDGLANDGMGWTKPEAEAERQRFRNALRLHADRLRRLAERVSGKSGREQRELFADQD